MEFKSRPKFPDANASILRQAVVNLAFDDQLAKTVTVTDADCTTVSNVAAWLASTNGNSENEGDDIDLLSIGCSASDGSFDASFSLLSPCGGAVSILYMIA